MKKVYKVSLLGFNSKYFEYKSDAKKFSKLLDNYEAVPIDVCESFKEAMSNKDAKLTKKVLKKLSKKEKKLLGL